MPVLRWFGNNSYVRDVERRYVTLLTPFRRWYFGMLTHIGADHDSKLVPTIVVTALNARFNFFVNR